MWRTYVRSWILQICSPHQNLCSPHGPCGKIIQITRWYFQFGKWIQIYFWCYINRVKLYKMFNMDLRTAEYMLSICCVIFVVRSRFFGKKTKLPTERKKLRRYKKKIFVPERRNIFSVFLIDIVNTQFSR